MVISCKVDVKKFLADRPERIRLQREQSERIRRSKDVVARQCYDMFKGNYTSGCRQQEREYYARGLYTIQDSSADMLYS